MSIEIPTELQPQIDAAIARGNYANAQELVSEILRATVPALEHYQQLRKDVQESLAELHQGNLKVADFGILRQRILEEYDEVGNEK